MSITVFINTMARYRRYTKTIVRAPKKKWNKGIVAIYPGQAPDGWILTSHYHNQIYTVCSNKVDNTSPTPGVLKIKHIQVTGQFAIAKPAELVGLSPAVPLLAEVIIMYLPQLVYENPAGSVDNITRYNYVESLISDHPEWIMARRLIKTDIVLGITAGTEPFSFSLSSGKLSRNLNSGDRLSCIVRVNSNVALPASIGLWYNIDASFASTFN